MTTTQTPKAITATDIIDSATDLAVEITAKVWEQEGLSPKAEPRRFLAAVLRVQGELLERHLDELNVREPGRGEQVRAMFVAEYEAAQA